VQPDIARQTHGSVHDDDLHLLAERVREAIEAAEAAEAADEAGAAFDVDAARIQLQRRFEDQIEQRRTQHVSEVAAAREQADAQIDAARRAAALLTSVSPSSVDALGLASPVVPVDVEPTPIPPIQLTSEAAPSALSDVWSDRRRRREDLLAPVPAQPAPAANIVIDSEAFAKVFASVLASLLDDRMAGIGAAIQRQVPAAPAQKPSLWRNAMHLDVVLLGLLMVTVIIVLAAWLA
jgi:hypothetical protein